MKIDPSSLDWTESHELLTGAVVPRPIAFVSTISQYSVFDVAPFSFFAAISPKPMLIGFGVGHTRDGQKKKTLVNIEYSREFVVNAVTRSLADKMVQSSKRCPPSVDKFKECGLESAKADLVRAPMVAESPINLECRLVQILEFGNLPRGTSFIIGEVVRIHIADDVYVDKEIQMNQLHAIARLGGDFYCGINEIFKMKNPD